MAGNTKNSRSGGSRSNKKTSSNARKRNVQTRVQEPLDNTLVNEILLIVVFAVCVLLFLCNFVIVGVFFICLCVFFFLKIIIQPKKC